MKTVKEVMMKNVPHVSPHDSLKNVTELMQEKRIRGLPVVDDGKTVGIITDGDILNAFYLKVSAFSYEEKLEGTQGNHKFEQRVEEFRSLKVKDVMTMHPRTINENATVDEAAGLMKRFKIKRLIVTNDKGQSIGLVERMGVVDSILRD